MEERQSNATPKGDACNRTQCRLIGVAPFFVGLVVALIFGWWLFPELMLETKEQPVQFNHQVHVQEASMDCVQCHFLRPDGTFSAFPTTKDCAVCHAQMLGKSTAERQFIDNYVRTDKEVKWKVYQKQPDNVFFSHAPHALETCNQCHNYSQTELCQQCHIKIWDTAKPPVIKENRLTTYTVDTMKMWQCEQCHANPSHVAGTTANNACFVCHK